MAVPTFPSPFHPQTLYLNPSHTELCPATPRSTVPPLHETGCHLCTRFSDMFMCQVCGYNVCEECSEHSGSSRVRMCFPCFISGAEHTTEILLPEAPSSSPEMTAEMILRHYHRQFGDPDTTCDAWVAEKLVQLNNWPTPRSDFAASPHTARPESVAVTFSDERYSCVKSKLFHETVSPTKPAFSGIKSPSRPTRTALPYSFKLPLHLLGVTAAHMDKSAVARRHRTECPSPTSVIDNLFSWKGERTITARDAFNTDAVSPRSNWSCDATVAFPAVSTCGCSSPGAIPVPLHTMSLDRTIALPEATLAHTVSPQPPRKLTDRARVVGETDGGLEQRVNRTRDDCDTATAGPSGMAGVGVGCVGDPNQVLKGFDTDLDSTRFFDSTVVDFDTTVVDSTLADLDVTRHVGSVLVDLDVTRHVDSTLVDIDTIRDARHSCEATDAPDALAEASDGTNTPDTAADTAAEASWRTASTCQELDLSPDCFDGSYEPCFGSTGLDCDLDTVELRLGDGDASGKAVPYTVEVRLSGSELSSGHSALLQRDTPLVATYLDSDSDADEDDESGWARASRYLTVLTSGGSAGSGGAKSAWVVMPPCVVGDDIAGRWEATVGTLTLTVMSGSEVWACDHDVQLATLG
eukprot:CAMPEP_0114557570 /NCGR_PEP_ID=MMETSP0114-20121206/9906_1 /TAXON_ID=31324 /ORGANISM="Goniomonas sp, Strain m" /LENGTH=634 /DNA_ID=CAMNT_0001742877 /DNA_START=30 /DNA_END=1935 /DNA_ORIENTATION=-